MRPSMARAKPAYSITPTLLQGVEGHALALPRRLHAAFAHGVNQLAVFIGAFVLVEPPVKAQGQRLFQPFQAGMLVQAQELLDPPRLDCGEARPGPLIVEHGRVHALGLFDGLEPHAVQRQPVFGVNVNQLQKLLAAEAVQSIHAVSALRCKVCFIIARAL